MAEVLSQQQIDELLGNLLSGDTNLEEIKEQSSKNKVKDYDFRSPKKFTREQLKLLRTVHENFGRVASSQLSSLLRVNMEIEVVQIEEQQYYEFNNALDDAVLVGIIDMNQDNQEEKEQMLVEISRPISYYIIDKLLGGNGVNFQRIEREYTEIELSILEYFFNRLTTVVKNAWINHYEYKPVLEMIETNSRLLQSIPPDETIVIIVMEMNLDDVKGAFNICIPKTTLDVFFKDFELKYTRPGRPLVQNEEKAKQRKKAIMDKITESSLQVSGVLGQAEITLEELMNLETGDVIPLQTKTEEEQMVVNIEGLPWFVGEVGSSNNNYAIKITEKYE